MRIFFTLIPWILFWVLLSLHQSEPAALAGFLGTFLVVIINSVKKRQPKILQVGTIIFFLILVIFAAFMDLSPFSRSIHLTGNLVITTIVLISIITRNPFTLQYAKDSVAKEVWSSPQFIRANYVISWVWLAVFMINLILPILVLLGFKLPRWLGWLIPLFCFVIAIRFTKRYLKSRKLSFHIS
jgi:hypothetical protein